EGNLLSGNLGTGLSFFDGAHDNLVQGNLVGTDRTGMTALGNRFSGIAVNLSPRNTIGGTAAGARNTISGNGFSGVVLYQTAATGNVLLGNFIGTDVTGAHSLGNGADGVTVQDAPANTIGGTAAGSRNLISGNGSSGIFFTAASSNNLVAGNWIGVDVSGSAAVPNAANGIHVFGAPNVAISRNVISGNGTSFGAAGIRIPNGASDARVQGNFIGTNAAGTAALGNRAGIHLETANNVIGGLTVADRNVISGNGTGSGGPGVVLAGPAARGNQLLGNFIGTNAAGTNGLGNGGNGVFVANGASGNVVGGT